jgi:hypothetical protein
MLRSVVGVLCGILMAGAVIAFAESTAALLLPDDDSDSGQAALSATIPTVSATTIAVLAVWGAGTFVGAGLAALVARTRRLVCAVIVGFAVMASVTFDFLAVGHPAWIWAAALAVVVPSSWLAGRLAGPSTMR